MASDAQTLVDHLQQRGVLQSSCHSLFVCQLFVHCRLPKETNYITVLQTFMSSHIHFHLPASSEACVPGVMWTSIWEQTKKKAQRWDVGWKTRGVFIPWTCWVDSGAAWLWWTGRWAWPCCSGGWWVWTRCPRCSRHHWPANQALKFSQGTWKWGNRPFIYVEELPTFTRTCSTTLSSSRERGCSGSLMVLIRCNIS